MEGSLQLTALTGLRLTGMCVCVCVCVCVFVFIVKKKKCRNDAA